MIPKEIIQIITGFIGSMGFAVLYNIRGKRFIIAALGGFLSWSLFVLFGFFISNEPLNYFMVSVAVSVYAEIMARVLKTPTTTFITTSLIPLIPGGSLYYTMAYAFESDFENFISKAFYTLQLASALALGTIIVSTLMRALNIGIGRKSS